MGRKYAVTALGDIGPTAGLTVGGLTASTSTRGRIFSFSIGMMETAADQFIRWILGRYTAAGTSTGVTPCELDPGDGAALLAGGENYSAEPTYTSAKELFDLSIHDRIPYTYHCRPGAEFVIPATAANGIGCRGIHASIVDDATVVIHYEE